MRILFAVPPFTQQASTRYFPDGCFDAEHQRDEVTRHFYGHHLEAAAESPLLGREIASGATIVRFMHVAGALGAVARIEHFEQWTEFIAKDLILENPGTIDQVIVTCKEYRVQKSNRVWQSLMNRISGCDYWSLPSQNEDVGLDGYCCVVEALEPSRYHVVDRWCPTGKFAELCEWFLREWETAVGRRAEWYLHPCPPWWRQFLGAY